MSNRTLNLTPELYEYLLSHSLREPAVLARLREQTATLEMGVMQISPEQGQFFSLLIKLLGVRRALEIGVFTGYSSLCIALALPKDGQLVACDNNAEWTALARQYWQEAGVAERVDLRLGDALHTLQTLLAQGEADQFDFAFIDADKAGYLEYYERCLQLVRPGGVIVIDNVLWGGAVIDAADQTEDTQAIRRLNLHLQQDTRVDISLLPIGDGLTLARRR